MKAEHKKREEEKEKASRKHTQETKQKNRNPKKKTKGSGGRHKREEIIGNIVHLNQEKTSQKNIEKKECR